MRELMMKVLSFFMLLTGPSAVVAEGPQVGNAFDFEFVSIDGKPMPLSAYKGRALLVVNTASFCGFTPQYKALEELHQKYEGKGLTVIGVPSNDFGGQEPKANGEIKEFCEGIFGVQFPLTSKTVVVGPDAHPFYKWVVQTLGEKAAPGWNFHKMLVGRDGRLLASYKSGVTPDSKELTDAIEAALAQSVSTN